MIKYVKLGEICKILNGFAFKSEKYMATGIRVVRITNVQKGYIEDADPEFYPLEEQKNIEKYMLYEGDLLISLTGNVGRVAVLQKELLPAALNQRVACLRISDAGRIYKPYLFHYLNSDYFEQQCIMSAKGVAQKNMSTEWLKEYEIPLPTIEKQREIAEIFSRIDELISGRKQQTTILEQTVKSRFIEMFGGVHDSKIYPYKAVKELTDVVSGGTPSRDISEYWEEGTIPWVKTTELQNNIVTEVEEYITEQGLSNSSAKIVPSGTVLIAMYGQGKTRGMTAYLGIEACTNQACACILPSAKINQTFLWQFFILSYDNLRDMAKGGNQPNLNGNMIKNYPILCPPRELQEQFAAFVEQVDKSKYHGEFTYETEVAA